MKGRGRGSLSRRRAQHARRVLVKDLEDAEREAEEEEEAHGGGLGVGGNVEDGYYYGPNDGIGAKPKRTQGSKGSRGKGGKGGKGGMKGKSKAKGKMGGKRGGRRKRGPAANVE